MFAQDVLCNSGEEGIVLSTTNFIAKNVFHHTSNSPRNKHQKHRQTSLKHGVVKFVSHSLISIQKFENRLAVNNFHYSIFFPSYVDDIAPVPPEA